MNKTLLVGSIALAASIAFSACDQGSKDSGGSANKDTKKSAEPKKSSAPAKTEDKGGGASAEPGKASADAPSPSSSPELPAITTGTPDVTRPNVGTPQAPVTSPAKQTYSLEGIKTIADSCASPHAILASAPEDKGKDYDWTFTRQAMLANQQYRVVDGRPSVQGEVSFEVHQADEKMNNAWVLVANCADGLTCNHLAAMYKAVVKSSSPQVFCGDVPANLGPVKKNLNLLAGGPEANLPGADDAAAKCARIGACTIADKTDTKDDVTSNCIKSPSSFKLGCARNYPCANVLACLR